MFEPRKSTRNPGAPKPKRVVIHPVFHKQFAIEAVHAERSIQDLVHEALCRATDRLDLLARSPEESAASASGCR
jgi:predicted HicB family RNase H-like nuclease